MGMEDDHFAVEVLTLEQHLAERRGAGSLPLTFNLDADGSEAGTVATAGGLMMDNGNGTLVGEDSLNLLLPVDSKQRRSVLRQAGVEEIEAGS